MYCEICKKETGYCVDQFSRYHLKPHHSLNSQQYYDIVNNTTEECPKCKNKRRYISVSVGYRCFCGDSVECLICNTKLKTKDAIGPHINRVHKIDGKEYYDTYLKKDDDGICKVCAKETSFINPSRGYRDYCSIQCQGASEITKENRKATNLKLFGVEHISNSEEIIDRIYKAKGFSDDEIKKIRQNLTEFDFYYRKCKSLTSKVIDDVLSSSHICYYTNRELIKESDNNLTYEDNYKNVDHITPIVIGYLRNIPAETIANKNNLCVCSRIANMIKGGRTKKELLELLKTYKKDKLQKSEINFFINTIKFLDF